MDSTIRDGATVQIEYTLTDDSGAVLDSNRGGDPLTYVQGQQQIIPGLEHALNGMQVGDQRHVTVAPEEAYGQADPEAMAELPREALPEAARMPGTEVVAEGRDGSTRVVTVREIRDETVVLDLNHPLAGKTLHFDVRIVDVASPGGEGERS